MNKSDETGSYSLGQLKYHGVIINPGMIPDHKVAKKYQKAVDSFFKCLSTIVKVHSQYSDISEKAYYEQFGKKKVEK